MNRKIKAALYTAGIVAAIAGMFIIAGFNFIAAMIIIGVVVVGAGIYGTYRSFLDGDL